MKLPENGDWEEFDAYAFRESGLLYMINKTLLWPIGMSIVAYLPDDGDPKSLAGVAWLDIATLVEPETIFEGKIDIGKEPGKCHPLERFLRFASQRIAEMPTEMEREMAATAMRKIIPGFDISPLRDVPEGVPSRDPDGTQEGS